MKSESTEANTFKGRLIFAISTIVVLVVSVVIVSVFLLITMRKEYLDRLDELKKDNAHLENELSILQKQYDLVLAENTNILDLNSRLQNELSFAKDTVTELEEEARQRERSYLDNYSPGDIISNEFLPSDLSSMFQAHEIIEGDKIYQRINGKSYRKNDNISLDDLRYILLIHYNYNHETQVGEIIVNRDVCDDVISIFRELYDAEYEIQSMFLVDNYWTGDGAESDSASIEENNTSCFNYRTTTGGDSLSNHAYGRAIDINPQQNPYIVRKNGEWTWFHNNAEEYVDRDSGNPHVIVKGDTCYNIFIKHGFSWGGEWSNPIDYQHFEKIM